MEGQHTQPWALKGRLEPGDLMKDHLVISTPQCNHKAGALLQPYLCSKLQAHLLEHEEH